MKPVPAVWRTAFQCGTRIGFPFIREVLAAWIMVLLAAAIAVLLLSFHEPRTDNRRLPRWHEPPVLDSGEWADDLLVRRGADWRCDIFLNCIQH